LGIRNSILLGRDQIPLPFKEKSHPFNSRRAASSLRQGIRGACKYEDRTIIKKKRKGKERYSNDGIVKKATIFFVT
jgi:hypothetical protein